MKNWIKVIFALNRKLDALTYSIDHRVENLASLTSVPAKELFESIITLNDKKVRIINLRVLHDKMNEALSDKERRILLGHFEGQSIAAIAAELGLSKGHTYRLYVKIIDKLTRILSGYGYDANKMNEDYKDIALVSRTYKKFAA